MNSGSAFDRSTKKSFRLMLNTASAWDILKNAVKEYQYNGDINMAAAIAFYFILSVIPFLILTIITAGLIFGSRPYSQDMLVGIIKIFHPYFSTDLLVYLGHIEQKGKVVGWLGIFLLVWFSSLIVNSAQTSLGIIFRSQQKRKYVTSKILVAAMILVGWFVIISMAGIIYLTTLLENDSLIAQKSWYSLFANFHVFFEYIIPYLVVFIFSAFVYKMIPKAKISWGNALSASFLFSTLAEFGKHLFTWYITNISRYHIIFGPLEAVMLFIVWVFFMAAIFLFCAELVSSYLKRDLILLEKAFLETGNDT